MTSSPACDVICDWLDTTYAPNDCPYPDVNRLLLSAGFVAKPPPEAGVHVYHPPQGVHGMVRVEYRTRFARISASGGACAFLRAAGCWQDYLFALSTSPHKVTRIDAALDVPRDGAVVIRELRARYPDGSAALTRKSLPIKSILSVRPDGLESGTWYLGYRTRARVTARVYDKALEMLDKRGVFIPPTTRYEITARTDSGATLRDAALPAALFWHVASPTLLQAPEGVAVWKPNSDLGWSHKPAPVDSAAVLRRTVEALPFDELSTLADDLGPLGREYLCGLLIERLGLADVFVRAVDDADAA